jgi:hypothetical protein
LVETADRLFPDSLTDDVEAHFLPTVTNGKVMEMV